MKAVVTGAAGFIGAHLCNHLLNHGEEVVGIDCFTDYYDPRIKEANIAELVDRDRFTLHRVDLLTASLPRLLRGADVVYHLAGQPGVRASWGQDFVPYTKRNVMATQRLLVAVKEALLW
jgi:nucleoside-diphosphate-sugar epimerase